MRPASATNNVINALGLAAFFAAIGFCRTADIRGIPAVLAMAAAYAGVITLLEILWLHTPWRDSAGLDFKRRDLSFERFYSKLAGVYGSFGFVAFLYWLFPEYHGNYYDRYWALLKMTLPCVWALAIPYVLLIDASMKEPHDSYYWLGRCLTLRPHGAGSRMIGQHLLGWVIKGYFLPLMLIGVLGNADRILEQSTGGALESFSGFFHATVPLLFTLDLLVAVVGYIMTLRLLDTHIRSSEPTLPGWVACLICYQPFQSVVMRYYFSNDAGDYEWLGVLQHYPLVQTAWGVVTLALLICYTAASVNFGCRFSNLTHRGILTGGMYRFTKHPAYLSKNLFWWMTALPLFAHDSWPDAFRFGLLLLCVNAVYYLRARTEERHLSRDPDYVAYALWMNQHGVLRRFSSLRYKAPANRETLQSPYQGIK